jgi:transposase InsO family protein
MGISPDAYLIIDASLMAFERRPDEQLIQHADRGSAYTSLAFGQRLADLGIGASFGSTSNCCDNAAVEAV